MLGKSKNYTPKWWYNGNLPSYKFKHCSKQISSLNYCWHQDLLYMSVPFRLEIIWVLYQLHVWYLCRLNKLNKTIMDYSEFPWLKCGETPKQNGGQGLPGLLHVQNKRSFPIGSVYGISTYTHLMFFMVNVRKYTIAIHRSYGIVVWCPAKYQTNGTFEGPFQLSVLDLVVKHIIPISAYHSNTISARDY